ncbi:MAG: CRISPR-associated protein Csx11 [Anaerolineales bacterium]|nr:CRISPR-associated protein Csx11 [Anaerolineales bacterium]
MSQIINLGTLKQHRNALLLAEVAAWLHMLGKFHEGFLGGNYELATQIPSEVPSQLNQLLTEHWPGQIWAQIGIPAFQANNLSIASLITSHQNPNASTGFERLMQDAHGRGSGSEKGALERFFPVQQANVYLSTAFGRENAPLDSAQIQNARNDFYAWLEVQLAQLKNSQAQVDWSPFRPAFLEKIHSLFSMTVAETRRPVNDVTLFDQTFASVAVFKAALAQNLLTGWKDPKQNNISDKYHWRILRVGIDGLRFWGNSSKIADVLGRRGALKRALDRVRQILEEEYPLGTEIYRDENGSLLIVPDSPDLLNVQLNGHSLQTCLQEIAREELEGEAEFTLTLSDKTRNMLSFGQLVSQELPPPLPDLQKADAIWQNQKGKTDVCPVCGIRPQGYDGESRPLNQKALARNVCGICERRRVERSAEWAKSLTTTVWTDEVADENGRLALIVGRFGLENWLGGQTLSSVMAFEPSKRTLTDSKRNNSNYDFEYVQFLNEITQALSLSGQPSQQTPLLNNLLLSYQRVGNRFTDTYDFYVSDAGLSHSQREAWRFALSLMRQQPSPARLRRIWETTQRFWQTALEEKDEQGNALLTSGKKRLEIVPKNRDKLDLGKFHAYELVVNQVRISVVWDSDEKRFITCDNLDYLAKRLGGPVEKALNEAKEQGWTLTLEEPVGYGGRNKVWGAIVAENVNLLDETCTPVIPLLAEPRTFLALVPANRALEVVKAIRAKYEREMGKVRNRLPLTLGAVYFGRRTPLAAAIETGRRMLERPAPLETWQVLAKTDCTPSPNGWPSAVCLTLKQGERQMQINVPTVMGDGQTPDVWYPYWRVEGKPTDRSRWFVGPDGEHWVHVCDLRLGDRVGFLPSTFDYEFLDTTARRFEVIYDQRGQRRAADKRQRPCLLEEIATLEAVWQQVSARLSASQIKQLEFLIESKRLAWGEPRGTLGVSAAFRHFVSDALREAGAWSETLEQAALHGALSDALEIYMTLQKEKPEKEAV